MRRVSQALLVCLLVGVTWADERMDRFLDAIASVDVLPEDDPVKTTLMGDYPGIVRLFSVTADCQFATMLEATALGKIRDAAFATNADEKLRVSTAFMLLGEYNLNGSLPVFMSAVTNGLCADMISEPAYFVGAALGPGETARRIMFSSEWRGMEAGKRAAAYEGLFRGLNSRIASGSETNRVVSMAMTCMAESLVWEQADDEASYLWPAYATSSNRYVAAQLARAADPPCASSNYLNRVIAELEALPPGTMQMLSTNHLGQAWQE